LNISLSTATPQELQIRPVLFLPGRKFPNAWNAPQLWTLQESPQRRGSDPAFPQVLVPIHP
jgi:hypothetical protein